MFSSALENLQNSIQENKFSVMEMEEKVKSGKKEKSVFEEFRNSLGMLEAPQLLELAKFCSGIELKDESPSQKLGLAFKYELSKKSTNPFDDSLMSQGLEKTENEE